MQRIRHDLRLLIESYERENGDCLLGNVEVFFTESLYNVWSKLGNASSGEDVLGRKDIRDLVKLCSEATAMGAGGHTFCA